MFVISDLVYMSCRSTGATAEDDLKAAVELLFTTESTGWFLCFKLLVLCIFGTMHLKFQNMPSIYAIQQIVNYNILLLYVYFTIY